MTRLALVSILGALAASCAAAGSPAAQPESEAPAPVVVVQPAAPPAAGAPAASNTEVAAAEAAPPDDTEQEPVADGGRALGVMLGGEIGESFGAGGLGLSGIGSGDGTGIGTIGGLGGGAGRTGSGFGTGSGRLGRGSGGAPNVTAGAATVQGQLDREIIRRIILRHRPRIAYCYERELVANPSLEGKLAVRFVIAKDGTVASASATNVQIPSEAVVACVLRTFQTMQFPAPTGGIVVVTYPFTFRQADGAASPDAGAVDAGRLSDGG